MTDTTATLRAIAQLRDAFPQGSEEWIACTAWYIACIDLERDERQHNAFAHPAMEVYARDIENALNLTGE